MKIRFLDKKDDKALKFLKESVEVYKEINHLPETYEFIDFDKFFEEFFVERVDGNSKIVFEDKEDAICACEILSLSSYSATINYFKIEEIFDTSEFKLFFTIKPVYLTDDNSLIRPLEKNDLYHKIALQKLSKLALEETRN